MEIQTVSVLIQTLCVPCGCRCRYCLLSWDGRPVGTDWDRALRFARRFREGLRSERPELRVRFALGYAMEPPDVPAALAVLRELDSPQAAFWQCDGMRLRGAAEWRELTALLAREGVMALNFTLYGLRDYHDRFAARTGDFDNVLRMMEAAGQAGLARSCGIPLTLESLPQTEALVTMLRSRDLCEKIFLFVPHEEGRGRALSPIRATASAVEALPDELRGLLNRSLYRTEGEWVRSRELSPETKRSLLLSLRTDNIERYERMEPSGLVRELEGLDDAYYGAFPAPEELAARFGDPDGDRLYRRQDLLLRWRRRFSAETGISPYDVTDERQSGSRRF